MSERTMWDHVWEYITVCSRSVVTPYWLCTKCGERSLHKPDRHGCNVEYRHERD